MKSFIKALFVTAASASWFYGFLWLSGARHNSFSSEGAETALSMLILSSPLLLPFFGLWVVRMQPRSTAYKLVLFPSFVVSLAPAVILISLILVLLLVPAPK